MDEHGERLPISFHPRGRSLAASRRDDHGNPGGIDIPTGRRAVPDLERHVAQRRGQGVTKRARAHLAELDDEVGDGGRVGRSQPHGEEDGDPAQRRLVDDEHRFDGVAGRRGHPHERTTADSDAEERRALQRREAIAPGRPAAEDVLPRNERDEGERRARPKRRRCARSG